MEIKNFGDLKKAILEGKDIEYRAFNIWYMLLDIHYDEYFKKRRFRTKPEKEYVPFTADDWREFENKEIYYKHSRRDIKRIRSWDKWSVRIKADERPEIYKIHYSELLNYNFTSSKPCGKEIIK